MNNSSTQHGHYLRSDILVDFAGRRVRSSRMQVHNYTCFTEPLNVVEFVHIDGITSVSAYSLPMLNYVYIQEPKVQQGKFRFTHPLATISNKKAVSLYFFGTPFLCCFVAPEAMIKAC